MTPKLCIHWRRRHVTDCRLAKLRSVFAEHPGGAPVEMQLTHGDRFLLPVTVDVSGGLLRAVSLAMSGTGMAHVVGLAEPFT